MSKRRPSWFERKNAEFLERLSQDPKAHRRAHGSWFGRFIVNTAERSDESWEPESDAAERVILRTRAERIAFMTGVMPGWLVLTDKRLRFKPVVHLAWAPWTIRDGELSKDGLSAAAGTFLSRNIHIRPLWISMGHLPGWIHVANLKITNGRSAWWLRVEDPKRWQRVIEDNDNDSADNGGNTP